MSQPAPPVMQQPGAAKQSDLMVCSLEGHRAWTTDVMGCFDDCAGMITACFFSCCMICEISQRLGDFQLMPFLVPGGLIALRARLRTLGGIKGSVCSDCLALCVCPTCTVCQMHREMKAMEL